MAVGTQMSESKDSDQLHDTEITLSTGKLLIIFFSLSIICAVFFTVGYAMREYGTYHYLYEPDKQTPLLVFILSQVFIYICP